MPPSRRQQQEHTRERLLEAAERVFTARGFAGASVDQVAAEAGLTKGAVYSNFASKEALVVALMRRRLEASMSEVREQLARSGPADFYAEAGREYQAEARRGAGWAMLVVEFWLYAMRHPPVRTVLADLEHELRTQLAAFLDDLAAQGGGRPALPGYEMAAVHTALDIGIALQALLDPERVSPSLYGTAVGLLGGEAPPGRDGRQPPPAPRHPGRPPDAAPGAGSSPS
ncbi:transcriptional regulator, TetR family [Geodermatophilus saharensis]|uniref:Transcriptional regulator, TetR family n=1 Tax=Geodermatophilus saharensis TaxID=1137994 RepID=A0A239G7J2_9ACTN|nr:TetR/AcrR family transcriptional regulator [Geodermatophilus saharensis]SNS65051.1 transcriptional regulator, TetR family [Geodermatophilus saharensis]